MFDFGKHKVILKKRLDFIKERYILPENIINLIQDFEKVISTVTTIYNLSNKYNIIEGKGATGLSTNPDFFKRAKKALLEAK